MEPSDGHFNIHWASLWVARSFLEARTFLLDQYWISPMMSSWCQHQPSLIIADWPSVTKFLWIVCQQSKLAGIILQMWIRLKSGPPHMTFQGWFADNCILVVAKSKLRVCCIILRNMMPHTAYLTAFGLWTLQNWVHPAYVSRIQPAQANMTNFNAAWLDTSFQAQLTHPYIKVCKILGVPVIITSASSDTWAMQLYLHCWTSFLAVQAELPNNALPWFDFSQSNIPWKGPERQSRSIPTVTSIIPKWQCVGQNRSLQTALWRCKSLHPIPALWSAL